MKCTTFCVGINGDRASSIKTIFQYIC